LLAVAAIQCIERFAMIAKCGVGHDGRGPLVPAGSISAEVKWNQTRCRRLDHLPRLKRPSRSGRPVARSYFPGSFRPTTRGA
jgi:hypothetical protein